MKKIIVSILVLLTFANVTLLYLYADEYTCKDHWQRYPGCAETQSSCAHGASSYIGCMITCIGGSELNCDP